MALLGCGVRQNVTSLSNSIPIPQAYTRAEVSECQPEQARTQSFCDNSGHRLRLRNQNLGPQDLLAGDEPILNSMTLEPLLHFKYLLDEL